MSPTAVIVDDEPNLSDHLAARLAHHWPELTIQGSAINGRQALALVAQMQPDIVFLDIHMPGLNGLQVAAQLPATIKIVFVTAFEQHAVEAFERAAVDYLLKPVSDERLQRTIDRLQTSAAPDRDDLLTLLRSLSPEVPRYLQWLRAGLQDTTHLVAVDQVVYFQADQKYTTVATREKDHYVRTSIKDLEAQLDPDQFWRIHRGTIVRVDQIVKARRDLRGRYALTLRDRNDTLRTSQTYGHLFKHM